MKDNVHSICYRGCDDCFYDEKGKWLSVGAYDLIEEVQLEDKPTIAEEEIGELNRIKENINKWAEYMRCQCPADVGIVLPQGLKNVYIDCKKEFLPSKSGEEAKPTNDNCDCENGKLCWDEQTKLAFCSSMNCRKPYKIITPGGLPLEVVTNKPTGNPFKMKDAVYCYIGDKLPYKGAVINIDGDLLQILILDVRSVCGTVVCHYKQCELMEE